MSRSFNQCFHQAIAKRKSYIVYHMLLMKDITDGALSVTVLIEFIRPKLMARQYLKVCPTQTGNSYWTYFDLERQYSENLYDSRIVRNPVILSASLP